MGTQRVGLTEVSANENPVEIGDILPIVIEIGGSYNYTFRYGGRWEDSINVVFRTMIRSEYPVTIDLETGSYVSHDPRRDMTGQFIVGVTGLSVTAAIIVGSLTVLSRKWETTASNRRWSIIAQTTVFALLVVMTIMLSFIMVTSTTYGSLDC